MCGSGSLRPYGTAPPGDVLHTSQSCCRRCGVLVSNPRVSEQDRDRYYQNRYYEQQWPDAERVLAENVSIYAAHDVSLLQTMSGGRLRAGDRALDVGSGYGGIVRTLQDRGLRAIGCEMSWRGCAFARTQGLHIIRAKSPGLPFADGMFDLVTSAHVIEHVGNPQAFVAELARLVRPGGVLAIVTDHADASQHKWNRACARARLRVPPFQTSTDHTFVFRTTHLRQLLEGAGCAVSGIAVYHHASPLEHWHWRAYKATFRFVDRLLGWGPYQLAVGVRQ
jgi:SAM-dependent methyltransferase